MLQEKPSSAPGVGTQCLQSWQAKLDVRLLNKDTVDELFVKALQLAQSFEFSIREAKGSQHFSHL
jgi:hypothetical protein